MLGMIAEVCLATYYWYEADLVQNIGFFNNF